ncbi:MAG: PfkB family carbohydrate kinase [Clostridia bacterium]|nr:PfkB family carbohydrate kinase [Clostridia bacterium]
MNSLIFEKDRELDIIAMGKLCGSLFVYAGWSKIHNKAVCTGSFKKNIEGTAANITAALAKRGMKTGYIGRVGDDDYGRTIFNYLRNLRVDTSGIIRDSKGYITGIDSLRETSSENLLPTYLNKIADFKLSIRDIKEDFLKQARTLLLSGTILAKSPSREAALAALEYARRNHLVILFDMDHRPYLWGSEEEAAVYYSLAAEKSDVVFGTKEELGMLEDFSYPHDRNGFSMMNRCFQSHTKSVIIKNERDHSWIYSKEGNRVNKRIYSTKAVNTLSANDAFIEAFIYRTMKIKREQTEQEKVEH